MLSRFSGVTATLWTIACQTPLPMDSPGKNAGVDRKDLREAKEIKKRGKEYTEKLYKNTLNDSR